SAADRAQLLTRAVELHRGTLLPGYFEEWILPEQQRLEERLVQTLTWLVGHLEGEGQLEQAIDYARRAVRVDPLREEAHGELMHLYVAAGQPGAALRQYRELERVLRQQLDIAPSAGTRALAEQISAEARPAPDKIARESVSDPHSSDTSPPSPDLSPVGGVPVEAAA